MKMFFYFFYRYPLVKLQFLFLHFCLVITEWGRARCGEGEIGQTELKYCWNGKYIKLIIFVVSNIAETVPLLLSFYAPLTETWLCMMERGRGDWPDGGGNIQGFYSEMERERERDCHSLWLALFLPLWSFSLVFVKWLFQWIMRP